MAKVIFMGSPEIAVPSLKALNAAGHRILAVVTQPAKPKGRGQQWAPPPVKTTGDQLGFPVLQPSKINTEEFSKTLAEVQPDFICVVAYGKILPPGILRIPRLGCINVHFSLLPKYRGAACVAYALMQGEEESGVTTMQMEEGLDTGPILMQWTEPIAPQDTAGSLSARLAKLGARQLIKTLEELEKGNLEPVPQRAEGASYAPLLKKEQGHLDWKRPAVETFNIYRGLTPWPGVFSFLEGRRLIWAELRPVSRPKALPPGTVELSPNGEMYVHCASGALEILSLKPEGKSVLRTQDFVRGLPRKENLILS